MDQAIELRDFVKPDRVMAAGRKIPVGLYMIYTYSLTGFLNVY